jgi:hypothetical protein
MSLVLLHQILIVLLALSVLIVALVVAGRLTWCAFQACRAARFGIAALSVAGIAGLTALLGAVVAVWFVYGLAHSAKNLWSDLGVVGITKLPIYGACYGLWRTAQTLEARVIGRAT